MRGELPCTTQQRTLTASVCFSSSILEGSSSRTWQTQTVPPHCTSQWQLTTSKPPGDLSFGALCAVPRTERARSACRVLLEAGCSQSLPDLDGHTPLLIAARMGSKKMVELLLAHGGNVHHVELEGCTSLMLASKGGHDEAVALLLAARADAAATDIAGKRCSCLLGARRP